MPETKDDIAAERDHLLRQVEQLQSELAATRARAGSASPARVTFTDRPQFRGGATLSEGERQELILNGVAAGPGGRMLLASDYDIEPATEQGKANLERETTRRLRQPAGIEGVDFVYPSIAPGVLAPDAEVRGAVPESAVADQD